MDRARIDTISIAIASAGAQTRRAALKQVAGGSLAALAATSGIGSGEDAAAKSRCKKRCQNKGSKQKRRRCRKRCGQGHGKGQSLREEGSAELVRLSPENCSELGTCRDSVFGEITGTPIADGTFTGVMTGTNIRGNETSITVDFSGTLIAAERIGADTIGATLALTMTQQREPAAAAPFTFEGTFVIAGGTGRFVGVTGGGTISGEGIRAFGGASGTVTEFRMEGHYQLKGKK